MKFGEKVRKLRNEKGWTQEELARKLGVTSRTVFTYENGTYPRYQSEEFITEATALYGRRGQAQAKAILDQTQQLFAGGELSEEDEIAFLRDIQTLYLDSKERAKKFTPRKYLKDTTADQ